MSAITRICVSLRLVVVAILSTTIITTAMLLSGCRKTEGTDQMIASTSVPELLDKLPNLQPYGIESCNYTIERSFTRSRVPSPSDVRVELKGLAKLSEPGFEAMRFKFTWSAIPQNSVPMALADIASAGDLLYSQKLNESFADNPTFAHGFVAVCEQEGAMTIYFLATDIDHPIR